MDDGRDIGGIEELGASGHKKGRAVSRYVRILLISILVVIGLALAAIHFGGANAVMSGHTSQNR
jgi:hypothetical protein